MTELSDSDRRRLARSAALGGAIWLALLVCLVFVPVPRKPETPRDFPDIQLSLNLPVREVAPAAASPASGSPAGMSPSPDSGRAAVARAAATKTGTGLSSPSSAKAESPAAPGLGIPNFSTPPGSASRTAGAGEFLDFSSERQSISSAGGAGPGAGAELEGTAAAVQTAPSGGASVSAGQTRAGTAGASSSTTRALADISGGAAASGRTASGMGSGETASPGADSAPVSSAASVVGGISFDQGAARRLVNPASPAIELPARLARLVDSDRTVLVQFTVRPDGTVPGAFVSFTPSAVLPPEIRDYLRAEFSRWRFEPGTDDGQARFQYSIRVQ